MNASADIAWAIEMQQHCREAGVPCFFKQLGAYPFESEERLNLKDPHGGDWTEWPEYIRVHQVPVLAAQQRHSEINF